MKKNIPWSFGFIGEAPHAKTELRSLDDGPVQQSIVKLF